MKARASGQGGVPCRQETALSTKGGARAGAYRVCLPQEVHVDKRVGCPGPGQQGRIPHVRGALWEFLAGLRAQAGPCQQGQADARDGEQNGQVLGGEDEGSAFATEVWESGRTDLRLRGAPGKTLCRARGGEMAPTGPGSRDNRGERKGGNRGLDTARAFRDGVYSLGGRKALEDLRHPAQGRLQIEDGIELFGAEELQHVGIGGGSLL